MLVSQAIIEFAVHGIIKRRDGRKLLFDESHHVLDCLYILFTKDKIDHQVSGGTQPDQQVPEQTCMVADIIEKVPLLQGIGPDAIADGIAGCCLQKTFININHLVKGARHMKT